VKFLCSNEIRITLRTHIRCRETLRKLIEKNDLILDNVVQETGVSIPPRPFQELVWLDSATGYEKPLDTITSLAPITIAGGLWGILNQKYRTIFGDNWIIGKRLNVTIFPRFTPKRMSTRFLLSAGGTLLLATTWRHMYSIYSQYLGAERDIWVAVNHYLMTPTFVILYAALKFGPIAIVAPSLLALPSVNIQRNST